MCLTGGFLLSIEALRLTRMVKTIEKLREFAETGIIDPFGHGRKKPLPFTWRFALSCTAVCLIVWIWARFLIVWTLTPALFVAVFLLHRFLKWSIAHSDDGLAAFIGFVFLTLGTAFQLAATVLS